LLSRRTSEYQRSTICILAICILKICRDFVIRTPF
jgi:hypothetical protein